MAGPPYMLFSGTKPEIEMNTADRYRAVRDSVSQGFDWEDSPQGYDYWAAIYDTLIQNIRDCENAEVSTHDVCDITGKGGSCGV